MERGLLPGAGWLLFVLLLVSFVLFFFFSFLFFFLFQSGNKRRIKALLSCGAVGWVFWRFIQTVVSIQPDCGFHRGNLLQLIVFQIIGQRGVR